MRDAETEAETEAEGEFQAPHKEPDVGLDPGPQDHTLSWRQILHRWATQVSLNLVLKANI